MGIFIRKICVGIHELRVHVIISACTVRGYVLPRAVMFDQFLFEVYQLLLILSL